MPDLTAAELGQVLALALVQLCLRLDDRGGQCLYCLIYCFVFRAALGYLCLERLYVRIICVECGFALALGFRYVRLERFYLIIIASSAALLWLWVSDSCVLIVLTSLE